MAEKKQNIPSASITSSFQDENGNKISGASVAADSVIMKALGDMILKYGRKSEIGVRVAGIRDILDNQGYDNFMAYLQQDSKLARDIIEALNPTTENGTRKNPNGVSTYEDLLDKTKFTESVAFWRVENAGLIAKNEEYKKRIEEYQEKEQSYVANEQEKVAGTKNKANKKPSKLKKVFIALGIVLLAGSVTGNIIQGVQNTQLEDDNSSLKTELDEKEEQIKAAEEALMNILKYNYEEAEGKSLEELIGEVGNLVDSQREEVKNAYSHFVSLLSDLGLSMEDCLDENGNFSVAQLDENVGNIVVKAIDNMNELNRIDSKLNIIFENCDIQKTDENGNKVVDKNGKAVYYTSTKDFASLSDAIDAVSVYLAELEKENDGFNYAISSLQAEVDKLKKDLDEANKTVDELTKEVETLKDKIKNLEDDKTPSGDNTSDKDDNKDASPVTDDGKDENSQDGGSGTGGRNENGGQSNDQDSERDL